jgi:uncharacterized membrane protein
MKKCFFTGLALLLPAALTLFIAILTINFLTAPFMGMMTALLGKLDIFERGFLFLSGQQLVRYTSQALIIALLFFTTVAIGMLTRWVIVHYFIRLGDRLLHRIPLINTIYKTSQEVIKTLFVNHAKAFKQVALVPFPDKATMSIGLITRENISTKDGKMIAAFVPTTPNPTSGFLMLFKREDITYLKMSVEEAFKFIISCGVIPSPFIPMDPQPVPTLEDSEGTS